MVAKSSSKFKFKLIEKKNLWFLISFVFITAGGFKIVSQAFKSEPILNYGIDFVGGTSMMIRFNELDAKINDNIQNKKNYHANFIEKIRMSLIQFGLTKSYIQITQENEVIIKTTQFNTEEEGINRSERLTVHLEEALGKLEILEIDSIGPTIGQELRSKSLWIIITVSRIKY